MNVRAQRALAVALTVLGILYAGASLWGVMHRGSDGIATRQAASDVVARELIIAVAPHSPAALAGIVPGDRVDAKRTPLATLFSAPVAGTALTYVIDHNGTYRTVVLRGTRLFADAWSPWKRPIGALLLVIACALVLVRPQRATWAFFAFGWLQTISLDNQYWPYPYILVYDWISNASVPFLSVALLYFSVAFLAHDRRGWHGMLLRASFAGAIVLSAAHTVDLLLAVNRMSRLPLEPWDLAWSFVISALTLTVLIEAYFTGRKAQKQRIAWVVCSIAYAIALQVVVPQIIPLDAYHAGTYLPSAIAYALWVLSPVVLGIGLLYAMTQYRVIDFRFAVSRALVYTAITAFLVAIFALVEWAAGRLFEGTAAAAYSGIALALLLGFTLNALHKRVDAIVDALFFRRELFAEKRLRHVAESILHADAEEPLAVFLVNEPVRALDLASAALFCMSPVDGSYARVMSIGWGAESMTSIERTDELLPELRATNGALFLPGLQWRAGETPAGVEAPLLAIPIKARGDLFGVAFYGGHTNGAAINADERELLARLAHNAGAAFDHIEASRIRTEMQRLRLELELVSNGGLRI